MAIPTDEQLAGGAIVDPPAAAQFRKLCDAQQLNVAGAWHSKVYWLRPARNAGPGRSIPSN